MTQKVTVIPSPGQSSRSDYTGHIPVATRSQPGARTRATKFAGAHAVHHDDHSNNTPEYYCGVK